jgi:hypothetical protein
MNIQAIFGLSILLSFMAFGLVTRFYLWPVLRGRPRRDALLPLLMPHTFRFIGLSFLVPGVVSPLLPADFAIPAAYGDLVALLLAMAAVLTLSRGLSIAIPLVWVFNIWGTLDFLFAFYKGALTPGFNPGWFGAAFYIPTVVVPAGLITHGLIFRLLVRAEVRG